MKILIKRSVLSLLLLALVLSPGFLSAGSPSRIFIRLKPDVKKDIVLDKMFSIEGLSVEDRLLKPELSLTFAEKNLKRAAIMKKSRIQKIKDAEEPLLRTFVLEYSGEANPEKIVKRLETEYPEIELAEVRYPDKMLYIPNDPEVDKQNVLNSSGFIQAWDSFKGDESVVIAVSDNGINNEHEDLKDNIAVNTAETPNNGIDDDGNGYVDDYKGYNFTFESDGVSADNTYNTHPHGTQTSGIAAAHFDNGKGVAGAGGRSKIFPLKIAKLGSTDLDFGYESIMYAAQRGFKVMNLSWGRVKAFSDFDQSIINYAVANDLALIASGGNKNTNTEITYPAGYSGVLGVGEVNASDKLTQTSLGVQVDIMAQGLGNYTTALLNDSYQAVGTGTSFSSPVVAGAAALARAKYPDLEALQALEFVRQMTVDITENNFNVRKIIPGRLNISNLMNTDPFSMPAIRPVEVYFKNEDGIMPDRFNPGDKAALDIKVKNYLGAAHDLTFTLSPAYDFTDIIQIIDQSVNISNVEKGAGFLLDGFSFSFADYYDDVILLRVDIEAANGYKDFFLISFTPTTEMTTFENDRLKFSVSDRGTFGFRVKEDAAGANDGVGFVYKNNRNQIFKGGIMVGEDREKVISANYSADGSVSNDFASIKQFTYPDRNIGIIDDSKASASHRINLQIAQEYTLSKNGGSWIRINLKLKNLNENTSIKDISAGYYLDWDIGPFGSSFEENKTAFFPEAIPEAFKIFPAACEIAEYAGGDFPLVGMMAFTNKYDYALPQAAGLTYETTQQFRLSDQLAALYNGAAIQNDDITDISMFVGMRFPEEIEPSGERDCEFCLAAAENRQDLITELHNCLAGISSVKENKSASDDNLKISPLPADDFITIAFPAKPAGSVNISFIDITGMEKHSFKLKNAESIINISTAELPAGVYILKASTSKKLYTAIIAVMR